MGTGGSKKKLGAVTAAQVIITDNRMGPSKNNV
jgi:hypothetical protein